MSVNLYAITSNSYRAIAQGTQLQAGETSVTEIPQSLLDRIKSDQARSERAQLLRDTDWTQMPDAQLTAQQKLVMATYRQALRDLPSLLGWPNVPWPAMPNLGDSAASNSAPPFSEIGD